MKQIYNKKFIDSSSSNDTNSHSTINETRSVIKLIRILNGVRTKNVFSWSLTWFLGLLEDLLYTLFQQEFNAVFPAAIILNPTINLIIRSLRAIRAITPRRNMYQMVHTRAPRVHRNDIFQNRRLFYIWRKLLIWSIEKFASIPENKCYFGGDVHHHYYDSDIVFIYIYISLWDF